MSSDDTNDDTAETSLADLVEAVERKAEVRRRKEIKGIARATVLDEARDAFEHEGNPVVVWLAIGHCVRNDLALPDWAQAYLAKAAEGIAALAEDPRSKGPADAGKALGFAGSPGRGNVFSQFKRWRLREDVGRRFGQMVLSGEKPMFAVEAIARELERSDSTIWRIVHEFYESPTSPTHEEIQELSKTAEFMIFLSKTR
jgi:hypothetical protein